MIAAMLLTLVVAQETPPIHLVDEIPTSTTGRYLTMTEADLRRLEREALGLAQRCSIRLRTCRIDLDEERKATTRAAEAWRTVAPPAQDTSGVNLPAWLWALAGVAAIGLGAAGCAALHCGR